MHPNRSLVLFRAIVFAVAVALSWLRNMEEARRQLVASNAGSGQREDPRYHFSEEARKEFLQGRDLQEKLLHPGFDSSF